MGINERIIPTSIIMIFYCTYTEDTTQRSSWFKEGEGGGEGGGFLGAWPIKRERGRERLESSVPFRS